MLPSLLVLFIQLLIWKTDSRWVGKCHFKQHFFRHTHIHINTYRCIHLVCFFTTMFFRFLAFSYRTSIVCTYAWVLKRRARVYVIQSLEVLHTILLVTDNIPPFSSSFFIFFLYTYTYYFVILLTFINYYLQTIIFAREKNVNASFLYRVLMLASFPLYCSMFDHIKIGTSILIDDVFVLSSSVY